MSHAKWLEAYARPHRIYNQPPYHLRVAFLEHVERTGAPEEFDGVCMDPVSKNEPFVFITDIFKIDPRKRGDGHMAPCPMCMHTNHYLEGALVYFLRLKKIAPIGHECADDSSRKAALTEAKLRREKDIEETYLWQRLPLIHQRLLWLDSVEHVAKLAQIAFRKFRADGKSFRRTLSAAVKNNAGTLIIHQVRHPPGGMGPAGIKSSSGGVETIDINYGRLQGVIALIHNYAPFEEFAAGRRYLAPDDAPAQKLTDESALELISLLRDAERKGMYLRQRAAEDHLRRAVERLTEFQSFFQADNLQRVSDWAHHPESPHRFTAGIEATRIGAGTVRTAVFRDEETVCRIALPPAVTAMLPPFPGL